MLHYLTYSFTNVNLILMLDILSLLNCLYCNSEESLELYPLQITENDEGVRINQGCLYCSSCTRFYIIKDEILYLSQDNLREKDEELDFLQDWQADLPEKIVFKARPWNLTSF